LVFAHRGGPTRCRSTTLAAYLRALRDRGGPVRLLIETQHPSRYGADVERRLVELLAQQPDGSGSDCSTGSEGHHPCDTRHSDPVGDKIHTNRPAQKPLSEADSQTCRIDPTTPR
jgi:hypothetical protein